MDKEIQKINESFTKAEKCYHAEFEKLKDSYWTKLSQLLNKNDFDAAIDLAKSCPSEVFRRQLDQAIYSNQQSRNNLSRKS